MEHESLSLECPLCGLEHHYDLAVSRMIIRSLAGDPGPWVETQMTRLLTCPTTNEKFEATLVLRENRRSRIESVEATLDGESGEADRRD